MSDEIGDKIGDEIGDEIFVANQTELNIMSILRLANIKLELVSLGEMFDPAEGVLVTTTDVGNDMVISRVLDNNLSGAIEQALRGTVRHWKNYGNDEEE